MARICEICGKASIFGNRITYRGQAKKKGGVGKKVTGTSHRRYYPNLQSVRAFVDGAVLRIHACTTCIRSGHVVKPPQRVRPLQPA